MIKGISSFWSKVFLFGLMAAALSMMLGSSFSESAIMDELAHIPAGYSYVRFFDFRLNPEHPPIVKALSALPLLFVQPNFPLNSKAWTTDINGQWEAGRLFLYESGNDANQILRLTRLGPILLTLLLIFFTYVWASRILGKWWGLVPSLLLAFSPTVLAHGHYVTTDIGAALGFLIAIFSFVLFLEKPSWKRLFLAGICFGIAQGLKFSTVLLLPLFIFLLAVWLLTKFGFSHFKEYAKYAGYLVSIFAIGFILIIYPLYFAFTFNYPVERQVNDTTLTLASFADGPTGPGEICKPVRCIADLDIWMSGNKVLRPFAEYGLGVLMVMQRAAGGNTSYFMGEVSAAGSRSYFPVVYLSKETLPTLIIVLLGLLLGIGGILKKFKDKTWKFYWKTYLEGSLGQFAMISFVIFYWAYSMKSPLNIGVRHLMPVIPLTYILAVSAIKRWVRPSKDQNVSFMLAAKQWFEDQAKAILKLPIILFLLIWVMLSAILSYPHFLSYFNPVAGGTANGYRIVTDSNYDWGQDMIYLKRFLDAHPEIDRIALDYFGGGDSKYYLGNKVENWWGTKGNPADQGIHWAAISINSLQNSIQPTAPGEKREPNQYSWLGTASPGGNVPPPDYKAGTSIFIYKLK